MICCYTTHVWVVKHRLFLYQRCALSGPTRLQAYLPVKCVLKTLTASTARIAPLVRQTTWPGLPVQRLHRSAWVSLVLQRLVWKQVCGYNNHSRKPLLSVQLLMTAPTAATAATAPVLCFSAMCCGYLQRHRRPWQLFSVSRQLLRQSGGGAVLHGVWGQHLHHLHSLHHSVSVCRWV